MAELQNLSEDELKAMIDNAEKALKEIQAGKRKEVVAQIKELAASIGARVELMFDDEKPTRRGGKVAPKYRNPDNPSETWTGRGVPPKWMQSLINSGRDKSEFLIQK